MTIRTQQKRMKRLRYAYASSPAATRLNNGKGCWLVDDDSGLPPSVYEEREKLLALKHFENISLPIDVTASFTREYTVFDDVRGEL